MSQLVPVRLLTRYAPYNENEVAGFTREVAARLIAAGHAVAYDVTELTGDGSGESLPPIDETTDPPPPASGEGGEAAGAGEGEKAPAGDGTTPPAATTPKPKGKK